MHPINRILGSLVALFGAAALAAEPATTAPEADCAPPAAQAAEAGNTPAPVATPAPTGDRAPITGIGVALEAGGGVGGFLDSRATEATSEQGLWTLRTVFGTRLHFGGELAYVGTAQNVQALGLEPKATLIGTGFEAAGRFNLMTGALQPYAIGGVGWNHYSLTGSSFNTSDVADRANVMTFPLGAGVGYRISGVVLDARLSFRPAFGSDLIPNANLSTWDISGKAGFEF